MLKSALSIAVVGLGLKDIRAVWALMLVCAATLAGAVHLAVHHGLGWGSTLRACPCSTGSGCSPTSSASSCSEGLSLFEWPLIVSTARSTPFPDLPPLRSSRRERGAFS